MVELVRHKGLLSIAEGFFRRVMGFDHDAIGATGDGGAGHGLDLEALSGAVAGVNENGQMAEAVYGRHNAEVERIARVVTECADTALTQRNVVIAFAHYVLSREEEGFE